MARFVRVVSVGANGVSCRPKPRRRLCRLIVSIAVIVVLATASLSLAQRGGRAMENSPPRPEETTYPWPWFLAFILLGLAWYPAFKNSKRELEP